MLDSTQITRRLSRVIRLPVTTLPKLLVTSDAINRCVLKFVKYVRNAAYG